VTRARVWGLAYLMGAAAAGWALGDRAHLAVLLVACLACALAGWRFVRAGASVRAIVGVAVAARLFVFAAPPSLSDDGFRYLWDGYVQVVGVSPYAYPPADRPDLGPADLLERMNSPDFFSVYPPVAQAAFALSAAASDDWRVAWYVWKAVCLSAEVLTIGLLVRVAGRAAAALYLLHPLAWIEAVGQAHVEALLVPLVLLIAAALRRPARAAWVGAALALAALTKLYPIVLGAVALRSRAAWGAALGAGLVVSAPYLSAESIRNGLESVRLFSSFFEFGAAPFMLVKAMLWRVAPLLGPHAAQLMLAAFVLLIPLIAYRFRSQPVAGMLALIVAYLGLSATLHPWYLLPVLALAPLVRPIRTELHVFGLLFLGTYARYVWGEGAYLFAVALAWGGALVYAITRSRGRAARLDRSRSDPPARPADARLETPCSKT
jgi:hypothetical protein